MGNRIKKFKDFVDKWKEPVVGVFKDTAKDIYTELNPIEKWKKGKRIHKQKLEYNEKLKKEIEEKKRRLENSNSS